jgi:hypothetical protein
MVSQCTHQQFLGEITHVAVKSSTFNSTTKILHVTPATFHVRVAMVPPIKNHDYKTKLMFSNLTLSRFKNHPTILRSWFLNSYQQFLGELTHVAGKSTTLNSTTQILHLNRATFHLRPILHLTPAPATFDIRVALVPPIKNHPTVMISQWTPAFPGRYFPCYSK